MESGKEEREKYIFRGGEWKGGKHLEKENIDFVEEKKNGEGTREKEENIKKTKIFGSRRRSKKMKK